MQPTQLTPAAFAAYPKEAQTLAVSHLPLLRSLPVVFAVILLRELSAYDWKFPAERREIDQQLHWLSSLTASQREHVLTGFVLPVEADLTATDWVDNPAAFMEKLTAWLWSTHRLDAFRATAEAYTVALRAASPESTPTTPRLGIVVIGAGTPRAEAPLFRKLRPHGVHLTRVVPDDAMATLLAHTAQRAAATQTPFAHWYIDGGSASTIPHLTQVSYARLEDPRAQLLNRIQRTVDAGTSGPEQLRSLLAHLQPSEIGLGSSGPHRVSGQIPDHVLDHFQLSLLTEGAGAQIFATTFVQWAARECVRRAQPETLLVRYAPRQRAQTMDAMLKGAAITGPDTAGSLVDADMGAFYTWLNLRRLPGSDQLRFLAWYEDHHEAIVIGPTLPQNTASNSLMTMTQVLALLA